MQKLFILAVLSAASSLAQCTLFDQTGCAQVYTAPANPSLSTYLHDSEAAFQYTNAAIAKMPQPKILLTAQIVPAGVGWLSSAGQIFGAAIQKYMGMLQNDAGVSTQDVNIWGTPFACDPSYSGYARAFTPSIVVPCDCGGGSALAKGAALPAGSGPHCTALFHYDGMFSYAAANGITMRTGWYPGGDEITSCGLTPAPAGVFTEAQCEECMIPFMQAGMNRYGSAITAVQVLEEPTGGMLSVHRSTWRIQPRSSKMPPRRSKRLFRELRSERRLAASPFRLWQPRISSIGLIGWTPMEPAGISISW